MVINRFKETEKSSIFFMKFYMSLVDDRNHSSPNFTGFFCNEVSDMSVMKKGIFLRKVFLHVPYQRRNIERVPRVQSEGECDKVIEVFSRCNLNDFCHAIRPVFFPTFSNARSTISRCSSVWVAI